ncbi:MAG: DUF2436 domain-containing protein, partial [Bacteroidales bacterium]|nr:DUF2436 domain-containing protein [Bacteroidales bacterium]
MRKTLLFAFLLALCFGVFAQKIKITQNSYQKVAISFAADSLWADDVSANGSAFSQVFMRGYGTSNNPGAPQLPVLSKLMEVPVCDSVIVTIVNAQYTEYAAEELGIAHPLYPSQPSMSKSAVGQPFAYDQAVYSTDAFYALPLVSVERAGIRRDLAMANVFVSPVQYNPVTHRIRIYTRIDAEFTFASPDMTTTNRLKKYASPMFSTDTGLVVNKMKNGAKDEYKGAPIKYLIIANSMFSSNTSLAEFVEWKRRLGYLVEVAYTNSVGTTTTAIKNYIQSKYNSATAADPAPTFLLLIGDVAQLPSFSNQTSEDHVTDLYYATLAGSDNIPDCYYGRLSATSNTQLSNQIAKILTYEQYTMPDPSYLGNAVLIAGTDGNGYSPTHADGQINYMYNNYVNPNSTTHNFTTVYKHNYNCSSQAATIRSEINAGVGFANYTAHGSSSGWADPAFTTSHVSSMTNANKYGLLIGNCCLSGKFDDSECFGESLLRAANKGAMGYIGASNSSYWNEDVYWAVGVRSSINASMSYNASRLGVHDKLFHTHGESHSNWVSTIGGIVQGGNLSVQSSTSSRKKYYWEIYHCFGDPSVRVYLGIPSAMSVSADASISPNIGTYTVQAAPYAYVALKKNTTEFIAAGFANASGSATLVLPSTLEVGDYELVALAQNYIPYFQNVEVIEESGCISPTSLTVANVTTTTADVTWTGASGRYNIGVKAGAGDWTTVATNITATSHTLTGLSANTTYMVRVQSLCDGETSSWRSASFSTPLCNPEDVCSIRYELSDSYGDGWNGAELQVTDAQTNKILASWTISEGSSATGTLSLCHGRSLQLAWISGSYDSECSYAVTDVNGDVILSGSGAMSNAVNHTMSCVTPACPKPTGLSVLTITSTSATLGWTGNSGDTGWQICLNNDESHLVTANSNPFTVTGLTPETAYTAKVRATCGDGEVSLWSNSVGFVPSDKITIGDGTTTSNALPCNNYYKYSLTQQLYTASELGGAGDIVSIDFYKNSTTACSRALDVYMVGTGKNNFSGSTDWITVSSADRVFSGSVTFTDNAWTTITLDVPFAYDGVQNVAIIVDDNTGSYERNAPFLTFSATGQAIRIYNDNTNFDPYSPTSYSGTVESVKNQIRIGKRAAVGCSTPEGLTISDISGESAVVGWDDEAESCNLRYKVNDQDAMATVILTAGDVWGDGTGYQMLLDANATAYGEIIPSNGGLTSGGDASEATYAAFEYKIPVNADGSCSTLNIVFNNSVSIQIPAGVYDWCITNPTPGDRIWIASANGEVSGRADNYTFEAGKVYAFTVSLGDSNDRVNLTVSGESIPSNEWTVLQHVTSPHTLTGLNCGTPYMVEVQADCGENGESEWTQAVVFETERQDIQTDVHETLCENELPFVWNGVTYNESGDYSQTFTNAAGCDSVVTLHLTVNSTDLTELGETACGSYEWNGVTYDESGDYVQTFTNVAGCDSVVTLHLTVNATDLTELVETACDSYEWNGVTYNESGNYVQTFTNAAGCDSVVTLHLTVNSTALTELVET